MKTAEELYKELSSDTYTPDECVEFIYKILQAPGDQAGVICKIIDDGKWYANCSPTKAVLEASGDRVMAICKMNQRNNWDHSIIDPFTAIENILMADPFRTIDNIKPVQRTFARADLSSLSEVRYADLIEGHYYVHKNGVKFQLRNKYFDKKLMKMIISVLYISLTEITHDKIILMNDDIGFIEITPDEWEKALNDSRFHLISLL